MSAHALGEVCAGIAVVVTIFYLVLGTMGIRSLRDIRDDLRRHRTP
jgi:hypothetical protein